MDQNKRQLLAAFCMGALLPGLLLRLGALADARPAASSAPNQTVAATAPTAPAAQSPARQETMIPVLMADGNVQAMELEEYLLGVVLAEMPVYFEEEALKAQAVAARTCALQCSLSGTKHSGGAVCTDSTCCQAYMAPADYLAQGGAQESVDKLRRCVEETRGLVLTYQGALIQATYFSCSGGRTEDAVAVWGGEVPYLQSVESPGEEWAEVYTASRHFTRQELEECLGRSLSGSPESWLGLTTYTRGGGVATAILAEKSYTGTELRRLLGLNSTAFTLVSDGTGITVTTRGKGHRVGMSQYGADAMALAGKSWQEILFYYFQGISIDKLENVL